MVFRGQIISEVKLFSSPQYLPLSTKSALLLVTNHARTISYDDDKNPTPGME